MKRLFTMGLALLMVLTMVPMSCHASNLDAGIGAESVMLASMTVSAVAVDKPVDMGDNQDSSEDWRVVTEEDGSVYLQNDATDEIIVYAFRIDENGNEQSVDLAEYAHQLNTLPRAPESSDVMDEQNDQQKAIFRKPGTSTYVYSYKETKAYETLGDGIKVTPDAVGPATITYGESVTVSEEFSVGISASATIKDAITSEVSFDWHAQLSSSSNFTVAKQVAAGRTGYVEFTPRLMVTEGTMTRKLVHIPGGVVSSSEFEAWGKSPIMLATGYADGIYDVKYK